MWCRLREGIQPMLKAVGFCVSLTAERSWRRLQEVDSWQRYGLMSRNDEQRISGPLSIIAPTSRKVAIFALIGFGLT